MILVYRPDKTIHQFFYGFGAVATVNGTLHIDGRDTTTCAADVLWKYIADQAIDFGQSADYYDVFEPLPTADSRIAAIEMYLLEQELGL